MKTSIISYDFGEYCVELASELVPHSRVQLLLPAGQADVQVSQIADGVIFQPFAKPRLRQAFAQTKSVYAITKKIRAWSPDVVHLQEGHLWFNLALPLIRRHPLVVTVHDPRHHLGDRASQKTPQKILDFGVHRAAQIIVHAKEVGEQLVDACGIPAEKVNVIPLIALRGDAEPEPPSRNNPTVLFFGRIWKYKGLEYLIRAEPLIAAEIPDVRFVIAGTGEDLGPYKALMVNPERYVIHNRYLSTEERAQLFREASVVVLPYLEATQSGVLPLAYAFGRPVVATSVGGLPDMVDEGKTGYLIPPRDERALAARIVAVLKNPVSGERMGRNGRAKLDAECSGSVVARKTIDVYRRAAESSQRRGRDG